MATEFDDSEEVHYVGFYTGTVEDNEDPLGLARIKACVPGILDKTGWAFPFGGPGGGSNNSGWFDVPEEKADVVVFFMQGDVDVPFYCPAHWGMKNNVSEVPDFAAAAKGEDAKKIKGYETERYQMVFDHREGKEKFQVLDKETGDFVTMDPTNGITLSSPTKVIVEAPKIYLGGDNLDENPITGEGVALAQTLDTFSGTTAGQRGQASTVVFAKKL